LRRTEIELSVVPSLLRVRR